MERTGRTVTPKAVITKIEQVEVDRQFAPVP